MNAWTTGCRPAEGMGVQRLPSLLSPTDEDSPPSGHTLSWMVGRVVLVRDGPRPLTSTGRHGYFQASVTCDMGF